MTDTDATPPAGHKRRANASPADTPTAQKGGADAILLQPPPSQGGRVSARSLRMALAMSVAVNLLVFGMLGGSFLFKHDMGGRGEMARDLNFGPIGEALAPQDRHALRAWLQGRAPELRSANKQRSADLLAVQTALRADPFQPDALRAALQSLRGRLESQLSLGHEALTDIILKMPDVERRALADRLERGLRHSAKQDRSDRKGDNEKNQGDRGKDGGN